MEQGLVSIVTPLYNASKYFKETYESVISQTYTNWEWFIIDDCSSDDSFNLALELTRNDSRIHLLKQDVNGGTAKARNQGLKRAKGQYITFLDADDIYKSNFLQKQIEFMEETKCPFVFSSYLIKSEKRQKDYIVPEKVTYKYIIRHNCISCLTAMYDASVLGVEYMSGELEDWVCWLQLLKRTPYALGNKESLAIYRISSNSKSSKKFKLIKKQWRVYRKVEKINFFKSFYYLMCWAVAGIKKYRGIK